MIDSWLSSPIMSYKNSNLRWTTVNVFVEFVNGTALRFVWLEKDQCSNHSHGHG